jgi:hypothetical protein
MRKWPLLPALALCALACSHRKTLTQQLKEAFSSHLTKIAPEAGVDSIRILWSTPVNERLSRVIDDTVYIREYNRIKGQLQSALQKNDRDSMAFYRYEIAVMEREIDSITKSIGEGDTTRNFGSLLSCAYFLRKDDRHFADSTLLYLDSAHVLRYTGYMDSSIARTLRQH